MRALPGLLIEYLINGAVALLWVVKLYPQIDGYTSNGGALLLLPVLYVAGMAIDLIAFGVGYFPKHILRSQLNKKYGLEGSTSGGSPRKAFIIKNCPSLAEELEKRSSRDRIARGTLVNLLALLYVYEVPVLVAAASVLFALAAWLWFESQSYSFEIQAAKVLDYPNSAGDDP